MGKELAIALSSVLGGKGEEAAERRGLQLECGSGVQTEVVAGRRVWVTGGTRGNPCPKLLLARKERQGVPLGVQLHRLMAYLVLGNPPTGKPLVMHACHNKQCLNPACLSWGDAVGNCRLEGRKAVG